MSEAVIEEHPAERGPGAILKSARSRRGLSLADVAQRLKYGERQIEALEADAFSRLPGTTIVRGMVRGYCKLLEIDAAPVLESFERHHVPSARTVESPEIAIPFPNEHRRSTRLFIGLSAIVALAVVALAIEWHFGDLLSFAPALAPALTATHTDVPPVAGTPASDIAPQPTPEAEAPTPASMPPEIPIAVANPPAVLPTSSSASGRRDGPRRISLEFQREAWVEIRDGQGRKLISQMNPSGTHKVIEGVPPFDVVIGNAPNVRLRYNDEPVDLRPHFKVDVARLTLK
jgi:cytoskeleton protein RodZ